MVFEVPPLKRPVAAFVRPPGSKSLTNRALVVAALVAAGSASRIEHPLEAEDTRMMRSALRAMGVLIDDNDDPWLVLGTGGALTGPSEVVDAGASGTTVRFITAVAALASGVTTIDGTPRMRRRPIGPLVDALVHLGVGVTSDGGFPPVRVWGGGIPGGVVTVDSTVSSQFASALLLVAPLAGDRVEITLGGPVVSRPYLSGTLEVMGAFGAQVTVAGDTFTVEPTGYRKAHYHVEADASAAVYPAVAAAVTSGHVDIAGIPLESTQPDLVVLGILEQMGCMVVRHPDHLSITGPANGLSPVHADLSGAPDGAMALAVACLFADGDSRLGGLSTLRLKETDRLAALQAEIRRVGGRASVEDDALLIGPGDLHGAEIATYDDHRMAMSMALVGLVVPGVVIREPSVVSKTWPGFFEMLVGL